MKKLFFSFLAFMVLSVGFIVYSADDTNALYAPIPTTGSLSVISGDGTKNFDVSEGGDNSWLTRVANEDYVGRCDYTEELYEAKFSGSIAVSQGSPQLYNVSSTYQKSQRFVYINFSTVANKDSFISLGDDYTDTIYQTSFDNANYWAIMSIRNDGTYNFNCNSFNTSGCTSNDSTGVDTCQQTSTMNYLAGQIYTGFFLGWLYYTTFDVEYPSDWDGNEIPSVPSVDPSPEIIRPDFSWVTTDLNMKITHIKKAELLPNGDDYKIGITIGFCPDGYSEVGALCDNYEALRYDIIDKGGTYSYDAYQYGDYLIAVEYTWQECTRYPSYPATPDYCYITAPEDTEEYDFESTEIRLNLGKQYSSSGSTIGQECDVSGYCEAPSPYEDCSSFGVDIGGYFQCVISNFGTWLSLTLQALFIPNFGLVKMAMDSFTASVQSQFGFLYRGFEMLVQWINGLLTITPDCTVGFGSATFFGATINYNFCAFEESAPSIYNPLFTTLRLIVAASFVFIAYRRLLDVVRGLGS